MSRIFNVLVLFIFLTGAAINSTVSSSFSVTEGQQPINVSSKNFPPFGFARIRSGITFGTPIGEISDGLLKPKMSDLLLA